MKPHGSVRAHVLVGCLAVLVMLVALAGITVSSSELPTPVGTIDSSATEVVTVENPSQAESLNRIKAQSAELDEKARQQGLVVVCESGDLPPGGQTRCGPGTPSVPSTGERLVVVAHDFGTRGWIGVEAAATLVALAATVLAARRISRRVGRHEKHRTWVDVDPGTGLRTWH